MRSRDALDLIFIADLRDALEESGLSVGTKNTEHRRHAAICVARQAYRAFYDELSVAERVTYQFLPPENIDYNNLLIFDGENSGTSN